MKIIQADIWDLHKLGKTIIIPVNFKFVSGRGLASQWREKFPNYNSAMRTPDFILSWLDEFSRVDQVIEDALNNETNFIRGICIKNKFWIYIYYGLPKLNNIIFFPTKYNWHEQSSLKLIESSMRRLNLIAKNILNDVEIYIPKVGCGFGELDWDTQVCPVVSKYLTDNMFIVTPPPSVYKKYRNSFQTSVRKDKSADPSVLK